jgi:hypothetical protein
MRIILPLLHCGQQLMSMPVNRSIMSRMLSLIFSGKVTCGSINFLISGMSFFLFVCDRKPKYRIFIKPFGRYPALFCEGKSPGGNQAVQMEMIDKCLRPCMQNADESKPAFKSPLRIFGKGLKGLIDSGKQDVQGCFFVGQYNGVKVMWQGEYQVEVTARKQFCFAVI